MFLVGLTGGISTGKSVVSAMIKESGVPIIDCDIIARKVVEPGRPAHVKILRSFGPNVFKDDGQLDRVKLGQEIFSDVAKRKLLNSIVHPYIHGEMKKEAFAYFLKGEQFVVMDVPLLFETESILPYVFKTIVVACDAEIQLERLITRDKIPAWEAKKKIEAQMSLEEKIERADFIIENSGSMTNSRKQVDDILKMLRASKRHIRNRIICASILIFFVSFFVLLIYVSYNKLFT